MDDLYRIRTNPDLKHMTIGILSFYKAQITRFKVECFKLLGVTIIDSNEYLSNITTQTVDSTQGVEFDVVLLSFVHTTRLEFLREPYRLLVALTRAKWILGIYTS
jgi:superfamily I DNA and/or RNA helicase